jgi:hypothetical protein
LSFTNEQGSVVLYALLVLVPIALFLGLLLDLARLRAAEKMAEQQTKAAARSLLSGYDRKLREEYGLFGLAAGEEERLAFAAAPFADPGGGFSMVRPRLLELSAEPVYSLADHRLFRRQMLEEMKLKGPVEFTRRVYGNWKASAEDMEKAAHAAEWGEEAEKLLREREEALRDAFRTIERIGALMERGAGILGLPPPLPAEREGGGSDEDDAAPETDQPENPYAGAWAVFSAMQDELETLGACLRSAEEAEARIRSAMDEADGDLLDGVDLYGSGYYGRYALEAGRAVSRFGTAAGRANADPPNWDGDLSFAGEFRTFRDRLSAEERQRREAYDELERKKEWQRTAIREQMEKVKEKMGGQSCTPEEEAIHRQLAALYEKYSQLNPAGGESKPSRDPAGVIGQEPDRAQKSALVLLRELSGLLSAIRDEALVNEYVLFYFRHRVTGLDGNPALEDVGRRPLKGEVEYVLYGFDSCAANRAAAVGEMFAVRFAVRTAEALADVRKAAAGSPLLILLTAAAEGAANAYADLDRLLEGEAVPVFQRRPALKMGYADYLRVFLALQPDETKKMARMQALIERNTGIRLDERPAYVKVVTKSGIDLGMFTAVARRLAPDAGEGKGRSAIIVKQAEMAY